LGVLQICSTPFSFAAKDTRKGRPYNPHSRCFCGISTLYFVAAAMFLSYKREYNIVKKARDTPFKPILLGHCCTAAAVLPYGEMSVRAEKAK